MAHVSLQTRPPRSSPSSRRVIPDAVRMTLSARSTRRIRPSVGAREVQEHLVVVQRQAVPALQLRRQLARDRGVRAQERDPGVEPARGWRVCGFGGWAHRCVSIVAFSITNSSAENVPDCSVDPAEAVNRRERPDAAHHLPAVRVVADRGVSFDAREPASCEAPVDDSHVVRDAAVPVEERQIASLRLRSCRATGRARAASPRGRPPRRRREQSPADARARGPRPAPSRKQYDTKMAHQGTPSSPNQAPNGFRFEPAGHSRTPMFIRASPSARTPAAATTVLHPALRRRRFVRRKLQIAPGKREQGAGDDEHEVDADQVSSGPSACAEPPNGPSFSTNAAKPLVSTVSRCSASS